jgi:hypothetical protein
MKYVITESQYKLLFEDVFLTIKRRFSYEKMREHILTAELDFPTLCDDFGDEFEYAENLITRAVDNFFAEDFLTDNLGNDFDVIYDFVFNETKDWFGEYCLNTYRETCQEYNNI